MGAGPITHATGDTTVASAADRETPGHDGPRLDPGQRWGPYRIGRLLGRGGMGEVYEAEHVESGRRVAVKVLRRLLRDADDRGRFIREGQLAASVSHPHAVYVFGSDEIAGLPVISMELLPGGTLKDRVKAEGPLAQADAVDAILQVRGGLDAAQAAGVLHRDVKPSNCFIDTDGTVKIGDFGLSISTLARDVHHELETGVFQGTPQFAAPEQLRGEPLDVRADIYSVGATLYYLLTGQPPFDARDLQTLVARVTTEPPPSPRRVRREIPPGLANVVMQCLAKSPGDRLPSYAALAERLQPFAWHEDRPASLGQRALAGLIDSIIVSFASGLVVAGRIAVPAMPVPPSAWTWLATAGYYLLFEGMWRASPGKRLLGLTITAPTGPASWARVAARTAIFFVPHLLVALTVSAPRIVLWEEGGSSFTLDRPGLMGILALALFATARRGNGRAAVHDLLSGTRVIKRSARAYRPRITRDAAVTTMAATLSPSSSAARFGPYVTLSEPSEIDGNRLVVALDPVLRRRVWIHLVTPGTPAIPAARRDVRRAGRLHWLTGRRSPHETWDAYEAPDGLPLLSAAVVPEPGPRLTPVPWSIAKHRLLDLAAELSAATQDDTLPRLGLERLWLRPDGRLVMLDFPAPGIVSSSDGQGTPLTPIGLLAALAASSMPRHVSARTGAALVPLPAQALIARWSSALPPSIDEALRAVEDIAARPDRVSPGWRAIPIGLAAAPVVMMLIASLIAVPAFLRLITPQNLGMLSWVEKLSRPGAESDRLRDPAIRDAAERYVVGRYGDTLRNEVFWSMVRAEGRVASLRETAETILARHPVVSEMELKEAAAILAPEIEQSRRDWAGRSTGFDPGSGVIVSTLVALGLAVALFSSVISAAVMPCGVATSLLGLAVISADGEAIGRSRSVVRVALAWLPAILWLAYLTTVPRIQGFVPAPPSPMLGTSLVLGVMSVGAIWTIVRPARGPHDRVAGTWVVPR